MTRDLDQPLPFLLLSLSSLGARAAKAIKEKVVPRGQGDRLRASEEALPEMFSGLRAVADLKGLARRILVYGGERLLRTEDGIDAWSVDELARALSEEELW